ncbi:MAG: methionine ABC transporter substrate-binding protein [Cellulomonadaceae bacterium]|jgi:D-methionine transport system substrate-binding protein|nr:methionine ABC transporter substrate-binding protein [Cellulomonadaceae bacterium]
MAPTLTRAAKAVAAGATALLSITLLAGCAQGASAADAELGSETNPVRIGVVNAEEPYRHTFVEVAHGEGIHIQFINFSDFHIPNQALADGDLDLNQFQHLQFLAAFNENTGNDLTPIGATAVYPLGLYSLRHDSVADFEAGAQIAIPNDPTNQARALLVLQDAGLITLRDGGNSFSTPFDIIAEESLATVTPVDAAQTALALQDVDGSIVNNSMIAQIGMGLSDALFHDDPASVAAEPYINVWVARAEDADNEVFTRIVDIFHNSDDVINGLIESSAGTAAVRNNPAADLQRILANIQENLRNQ